MPEPLTVNEAVAGSSPALPVLQAKWPESLGAKCQSCPLLSNIAVPCEPPIRSDGYSIAFVSEGPGGVEQRKGRPLVGEAGLLFNQTLKLFGVEREAVHVTNSTLCKPLKHMSGAYWNDALDACRERLVNELLGMPDGSLVVMLGARPIKTLTGKNSVKAWRGYPLPALDARLIAKRHVFFPTF